MVEREDILRLHRFEVKVESDHRGLLLLSKALLFDLTCLLLLLLQWFWLLFDLRKQIRSHFLQIDSADHISADIGVRGRLLVHLSLLFAVRNNCDGVGMKPTIHPTLLQLTILQWVALYDVSNVLQRWFNADRFKVLSSVLLLEDL